MFLVSICVYHSIGSAGNIRASILFMIRFQNVHFSEHMQDQSRCQHEIWWTNNSRAVYETLALVPKKARNLRSSITGGAAKFWPLQFCTSSPLLCKSSILFFDYFFHFQELLREHGDIVKEVGQWLRLESRLEPNAALVVERCNSNSVGNMGAGELGWE